MHQRSTMKHPSHQLDKASRDHWAGTHTGRNHSEASVDGFAPRSDKACCPATPGSHPANCLKTCTLEIVWSKSKYTCFTNASGLTALATGNPWLNCYVFCSLCYLRSGRCLANTTETFWWWRWCYFAFGCCMTNATKTCGWWWWHSCLHLGCCCSWHLLRSCDCLGFGNWGRVFSGSYQWISTPLALQ